MLMIYQDGGRSDRHTIWNVSVLPTLGVGDTGACRYASGIVNYWNGTAWIGLLGITTGGGAATFSPTLGAVVYSLSTGIACTAAPASSNRLLKAVASGTPLWTDWFIDGSNHLIPAASNTQDVGASATRVRDVFAKTLQSDVATGTSPLTVASTTKVTNLTSHYLGAVNQDDAYFKDRMAPVGSVVALLKTLTGTPAIPTTWVECNGQTLSDAGSVYNGVVIPNLNASGGGTQRFLRGSTTSGTIGGSETHSHPITSSASSTFSSGGATTAVTSITTPTGTTSTLPSYYEVVYIIKVK